MIKPNLWQKLAVVTAALMLTCCMALLALQMRANTRHEQEVVQRLSLGLAEHIAQRSELMDTSGMRDAAVRALFGQLMAVNPSVEVYLLDDQGGLRRHLTIFIDGLRLRDRARLSDALAEDSEVYVVQALSGG